LPALLFAQFAGTSPWFAGNAVIDDLQQNWGLAPESLAYVTSAVNLGFICGTLVFALLMISDRFSPRLVFFICTLAGATANFALLIAPQNLTGLLLPRFATGFFLAGIYPVGMKIAAGWYREDLGRVLGFLIGALVLGTAFPHLLRSLGSGLPWQQVIFGISLFSCLGGAVMLLGVPDGPHNVSGSSFNPRAFKLIFASPRFRASAFGYFGHMWELYTLWAFMPLLLLAYATQHDVALLVPLMIDTSPVVFLAFILLWGITVIGDSPQFSAMNARYAPREYIGSALTMVNSIGFLLTIVSIQLASWLLPLVEIEYLFWLLLPGPVLGLWALRPLWRER